MSATLTKSEVETDLTNTDKDIERLSAIVDNLTLFIQDTDEDRRKFRAELLTFEALLSRAWSLREKIAAVLSKL